MKINMLVQFMALLDAMRSREEVVAEFERLLRIYEFDFYGVIRQPKPHEDQMSLVLAGRWPKSWPETYIRKKYIVADPTIRYLGHAQSGFRWRDTIAAFRANPQRKRMEQPEKAAEFTADAAIPLTRREMEALSYLADGMTSNEIARILSISNHTVDWYMNGIQEKLNARNRHHAVALSFRLGLIS